MLSSLLVLVSFWALVVVVFVVVLAAYREPLDYSRGNGTAVRSYPDDDDLPA